MKYIKIIIAILVVVLIVFAIRMQNKDNLEIIDDLNLGENTENLENTEENKTTDVENNEVKVESSEPKISNTNQELFSKALADGNTALINKDYNKALNYYNEALKYRNSDLVYARMFSLYSAQSNFTKALESINKAIELNPAYTDYWNDKLTLLDTQTSSSFAELKVVYNDGLTKVDNRTKINLITHFARIAENNGEKNEAILAWNKAIEVYPQGSSIYQAEIDRLK